MLEEEVEACFQVDLLNIYCAYILRSNYSFVNLCGEESLETQTLFPKVCAPSWNILVKNIFLREVMALINFAS